MKNLTKKIFILLVTVLMVLTTGIYKVHADPKSTDQGTLTVNGLDNSVTTGEGEEVTFYRIAKVTYNGDYPKLAAEWEYPSNPTVKNDILALLEKQANERDYEKFINEMAQGIKAGTITDLETKVLKDGDHDGKVVWAATNNDGPVPGIYIAVVTNAEGAKIYNPALLTVLYDTDVLQNGVVDLAAAYNNSATLKSSQPGSDKAIKGNNTDDQNRVVYDNTKPEATGPNTTAKDEYDEDASWETTNNDHNNGAKTVSVGDKVDYEAEISIPEYPKNAKDQTIWFKDVMEKGLTFDSQYFTMKLTGADNYSVDVDIASGSGSADRSLSVTKQGEFYEKKSDADPAYYKGSDGNYYTENATRPTDVTIDTTTKYAKLTEKTFTFGLIKFVDGATNGGFTAVVTDYEVLRELLALDNKKPSDIKIRLDYSAILNESAVVGQGGNKNKLTYVYSNNPLEGETHKNTSEASGRKRQEDEEIVYTYEVSILKTDVAVENPFKDAYTAVENVVAGETVVTGLYTKEGEEYVEITTPDTKAADGTTYYAKTQVIKTVDEIRTEYNIPTGTQIFLPGAEFDVYDGVKPTGKLIGHVVSNANGIATLTDVAAGTYYFYETKAPVGGYSFDPNNPVAVVTANWTTCTWSNSYSDEDIRYTSDKSKAYNDTQVGWIKNEEYYEMSAFNYVVDGDKVYTDSSKTTEVTDVFPAYILSHTTKSGSTRETLTNPLKNGGGVAVYQVKNSKNPTLPSTGGIGTYLFTIAGVAIIATAMFMLIFRKREEHNH